MDSFVVSIECDACGRSVVVVRTSLAEVLDEDPSIVALMERFWERSGWIHDAAFGFAFCSETCARAHGVDERPDEGWLRWVTRPAQHDVASIAEE